MKLALICLSIITSFSINSQCNITVQPDANEGKDLHLFHLPCNSSYAQQSGHCDTTNFGDHSTLMVGAWTHMSTHSEMSSLLEFNLDSLANAGCSVSEAKLVLYPTGNTAQYHCGSNSTIHPCINNSFSVNRVTSSWDEYTASYVNQPAYTNAVNGQDFVFVDNEDQPFETYVIDLTDMVNYWLANPSQNFGMLLLSNSTAHYQIARFASSDHVDAWRRPKLVLETNCDNSCSNLISGYVFDDANQNCSMDLGENGLENWLVTIQPGPIYATTDSTGYYEAWVGNGSYTITQSVQNTHMWDSLCPLPYEYQVNLSSGQNSPNTNFGVVADNYCADLSVDIGAGFLRKCHTELFYVEYCNNGNLDETGVYIDIEFDPNLSPLTASIPWSSQNGNVYTFNIGDLDAGECGSFNINVQVSCATEIGDIECVQATIYPPSQCTEPEDPAWDKSSVSVSGMCDGDSLVCFTIENTGDFGDGDMDGTSEFRIYENNVLVYVGSFQLLGQDDTTICWPANGSTIRLEADQRPGHPGNSHPNEIIEDCGDPSNGNGCTDPVSCINGMTQDDLDPFTEIECLEVVASYDPNDKTPTPYGYSVERFISADDMIEYKIRFQNTGSDTAFKVVLEDQIDVNVLDITSIVPGVSSHPCQFEIYGNGIIKWTFDPIELIDSTTNEPGSKGFVKFKIKQQPGNQPGTIIQNFVDIYFDYNSPVRTDTAFNTIEYPQFVSVPENYFTNTELKVYPNPSSQIVNFEFSKVLTEEFELRFFDMTGRMVSTEILNGKNNSVNISQLDRGVYLYQVVKIGKSPSFGGKLVVE